MNISVILWGGCALFAFIIFLCVRETTALVLFLSAVNAFAFSFIGDLRNGAMVFAASFGVIMLFAAITSVIMDLKNKKREKVKKR